jgi:hypothetical protein
MDWVNIGFAGLFKMTAWIMDASGFGTRTDFSAT